MIPRIVWKEALNQMPYEKPGNDFTTRVIRISGAGQPVNAGSPVGADPNSVQKRLQGRMIPAWAGGLILALAALLVFGPVSHDAEMRLINQRVGENSQFLSRQISANLLSVITHNERSVNQ